MAQKKTGKIRGKSKSPNKGYFTKVHQEAIVEFCKSECSKEKERLYTDVIREALEKLSENLIYVYGFHKQHDNVDTLKQDCVINLYETLHKFDHTKGHRAFSYFNVVAKHWLIIHSRKKNKRAYRMVSIDDPDNDINIDALFLIRMGNSVHLHLVQWKKRKRLQKSEICLWKYEKEYEMIVKPHV